MSLPMTGRAQPFYLERLGVVVVVSFDPIV